MLVYHLDCRHLNHFQSAVNMKRLSLRSISRSAPHTQHIWSFGSLWKSPPLSSNSKPLPCSRCCTFSPTFAAININSPEGYLISSLVRLHLANLFQCLRCQVLAHHSFLLRTSSVFPILSHLLLDWGFSHILNTAGFQTSLKTTCFYNGVLNCALFVH